MREDCSGLQFCYVAVLLASPTEVYEAYDEIVGGDQGRQPILRNEGEVVAVWYEQQIELVLLLCMLWVVAKQHVLGRKLLVGVLAKYVDHAFFGEGDSP